MEEQSKRRSALHDVVACILPLVCLAGALAAAVYVFRYVDGRVTVAQEELARANEVESAVVEPQEVYAGVRDPWIEAGSFTVGDEELDASIRDFCDEHTDEGATVDEAARATYDAIVESTYLYRIDKPMGLDWVARSAREFFNSDDGMGGHQGDVYEFASVLALCLRYFGYGDAIAVPIVYDAGVGDADGSALCIVTNTTGVSCVCDPSVGTAGWMLPRANYQILVDDIGQNLDAAEALGLQIQRQDDDEGSEDEDAEAGGSTVASGSGMGYGSYGGYDEYGEYGEYEGYDWSDGTDSY